MRTQKTYSAKAGEISRRWLVVDGASLPLGRLASRVAMLLRGKHKPTYTPHVDTGDHVIVVNADKVMLTGGKLQKKIRYTHSGYPGALREQRYESIMAKRPDQAVRWAVAGMLPKNILGRQMLRKLKVYRGPDHPHEAQGPEPYDLHTARYVVE
jgi:large subunit ribosomal protein L13